MADQIVMKSQEASSFCGRHRINDNGGGKAEMRRRRWMGMEDERGDINDLAKSFIKSHII